MKFDKLYLRVTALLNGREVHYDYVISPNADDLTDEKADLMKQELSESLLKDLPAGTKILSTEFIPKTEMIAPIFDGDRVTSWRFLDYVANILSPEPDMNGNLHPKFTPLAVVRVMVDEDVSLIQLEERERIRIMVGNYVMELTKSPIYTIQQITPDDYWRILKGIGVMRNFPDLSENPREGRLLGGTQTLHGTAQETVRGERKGLNEQLAPCLYVRRNPHTPPTNASFRTSAVTSVSLVAKSFGRYLYSIANPVHCEVS